ISASYRLHRWKLTSEQSQLFYFKEEGFPGAGMRDKLGENGRPPWRNMTSLSYAPFDRHEISLSAMTTAGQKKIVPEEGNIPNYTTLDLDYSYKSKSVGEFTGGIRNVMGTTPPLDGSNPTAELNTSLYDQIGRQYILGYKMAFQ